ncbi:lysine--tRNA ligase [Paenibacillus tianjinensis]|uniref:Lysine--tRNA ligase n=1 Tax=Paenibacillus tianjinensis TaxID=2810347 RepID=A0ABX7LGV5_9BACL|nr:lysine--tRNA ligase [Paenibacillus tianjinensis]QSF47325.1 lysine--tRNA ligase [Paenibacillus tianjinensis]
MHWAQKYANNLIQNHPERQTFVCASGISPSGSVHIGNFREIVTTYFVTQALRKSGKEVRFIFSWDDFDRFRKVPAQLDPSFEQYIGLPYTKVPCPCGSHASYAEHYEQEFEHALAAFGIVPEFIYQSREYQSLRYNPAILHALRNRAEIYDILMMFKTGKATEDARAAFYPVQVYCERCGKDTTSVHAFDEDSENLIYSCKCGCYNTLYVPKAANIKLHWKIDWPMRWGMEQVVFEPGGRDHSSETGSYNVAKVISERIFGNPPPYYVPYEFISIKGSHAKMSSSSGHNYTPADLLEVYGPEPIMFLFAKYHPNTAFSIGLDEDVLRNYTEFERYRKAYDAGTLTDNDLSAAMELSLMKDTEPHAPSFSQVSSLLPLINFDNRVLQELLRQGGEDYSEEIIQQTAARAGHWIRQFVPQRLVTVNENPDIALYHTLEAVEQEWINAFCGLLREEKIEEEELMRRVYAICHHDDKKMMRSNQKRLFALIYQLVLHQSEGPRIPALIQAVGTEPLLRLLDFTGSSRERYNRTDCL